MITSPTLYFNGRAMKWLGIQALLILITCAAYAQINPNDPSLRLWLKASTLTGTNVPVWLDSSTNGIVLAAPALPPGDLQNDPDSHTPLLVTANNNGVTFNAVNFRQANDPLNAVGHYADRLWQTNKLDATDPTLIEPASDITLIAVYLNNAPAMWLGPDQAIFTKRGPSACPYSFGLKGATPEHEFITYAGSVLYPSGLAIPQTPEWAIVIMNLTSDGSMTWTEYYASQGGWSANTQTGVARGGSAAGTPFTIGFHTQGAGGDANNPWGNGTYERFAGAVAELALYNRSLSSAELGSLQTDLLVKYFLKPGAPNVTTQPQSQQVNQFNSASFNVVVDGTPPFTYQWYQGGSPILGANANSYTIPNVGLGHQGFYSVAITNVAGFTNSQAAFLTVIPDTNGPTVVSALLNVVMNTEVTVTFSELVNPASATNAANYSISGGATVISVVAIPQTSNAIWSNYVFSVVLTTSPITSQKTLTVTGVQDRGGNPSAAQATIFVPVVAEAPPSANRLLWLAGDTNVMADSVGVYDWQDMAGAANTHNGQPGTGNAKPGLAAFPNGIHPVVNFDGSCLLVVQNQPDFDIQNFTVYLVGAVNTSNPARDWLGNWEGWVLGTADGDPTAIKWSNMEAGGIYRPLESGSALQSMVPAYIVGTFANPGNKTLSVNGRLRNTYVGTAPIDYSAARGLALGSLFDNSVVQALVGNIAEVLIYSSVSASQDAAIQRYIGSKYFSPSATPPTLAAPSSSAANNTTVTVVFSDALDVTSATNAANYAVDHGRTVSAVSIVDYRTVQLTTSPLTDGPVYILTVNGVKNWAGTSIAPSSQAYITGIPVLLYIQNPGGAVSLTWDAPGWKLMSADSLAGSWTEVVGATSPRPVTAVGLSKYYRLMQ